MVDLKEIWKRTRKKKGFWNYYLKDGKRYKGNWNNDKKEGFGIN